MRLGGCFRQSSACAIASRNPSGKKFDLIIGNPPYGRVSLPAAQRAKYSRSLFGHANLYGLFTDLALRWARVGGVIAYVTPTSFLAGEYFKTLRGLLAREAPPLAIDFVTARRGVFEDVLQETMLATYRSDRKRRPATVHHLAVNGRAHVTHAGEFGLPSDGSEPWLAPRTPDDHALIKVLGNHSARLADWGYQVSTGPLVWNRFKLQFRDRTGRDTYPVIWAEAVTADGRFIFRAEKRNHQPYFKASAVDDWLKVSEPCVLLQRIRRWAAAPRRSRWSMSPTFDRKKPMPPPARASSPWSTAQAPEASSTCRCSRTTSWSASSAFIARRSVLSPTSRSSWSEFRQAGGHRHREHAPAQRAARIAAAADRDRRRAQGHQPLDLRSADGARYAGRVGGALVRGRHRRSSGRPKGATYDFDASYGSFAVNSPNSWQVTRLSRKRIRSPGGSCSKGKPFHSRCPGRSGIHVQRRPEDRRVSHGSAFRCCAKGCRSA